MTPRLDTKKRFPIRSETGDRLCRECGKVRPAGVRWISWCSDACVDAYKVRAQPACAREKVLERDKGVCAKCSVDCVRLEQWLQTLPRSGRIDAPHGCASRFTIGAFGRWLGRSKPRAMTLLGRLWGVSLEGRKTLWDADHIVPLAEGGASTLENFRTLCRRCHVGETTALAGRLARRASKAVGRGF